MLNVPHLARFFVLLLMLLGLYLAGENTLISADVLSYESGASAIAATSIAVAATALELCFVSWIRQERSISELVKAFKTQPMAISLRLLALGLGLALTYHFDILTTAQHPQFQKDNAYFFGVVIAAFVFGPEACLLLAAWLWLKVRDVETSQMAENNHRDAENAYRRAERQTLIDLATAAGQEKAIERARERWGSQS